MRQRQTKNKENRQEQNETSHSDSTSVQSEVGSGSSLVCNKCLNIVKYVLLALAIPPFLNYASLNQESKELQPPGALFDIGFGQKLFLRCEGSGSPTVILEAPTGMTTDVWTLIQPELAKMTKVCSYDRGGLGFSDRAAVNYSVDPSNEKDFHFGNRWKASTVERMVDDLHRLVTYSSQQKKPFIFIGAELGGMIGRFYAQVYESDISDLVLIEPLVEDVFQQDEGIWVDLWFGHLLPYFQAYQFSAAIGLTRLAFLMHLMVPPLNVETMPEGVKRRQKHLMCNPRHLSAVVDEYHFINDSISQMKTLFMMKAFPNNISTTVINGNHFDDQLPSALNKAWTKSQQTLLSWLHPNSNHIVVNGADHHMIYQRPQAIIEPVKQLIRQRRAETLDR